jgi:hypothetical protein
MARYRKKPVVIEAAQFDGTNADDIAEMFGWDCTGTGEPADILVIETLNGEVTAGIGEWVIKGVAGEPYPCRNDIFEATYEPV